MYFCNMCRGHKNGLCFREASQNKVWERQRPLVSLDLLLAPAKEEITNKCVVIFTPVLSLAMQKVEQGLKKTDVGSCSCMLYIFTLFGIDTARDSMREMERKMCFRRGKGPPYNEEFNQNGGGGGIFLCMPDFLPLSS